MENKINILIVGNGIVPEILASNLRGNNLIENIYITSNSTEESETFKNVDIREDDICGLLKFALDKNIQLTIPTSTKAISADIGSYFQENGMRIFAGSKNSYKLSLDKIFSKKYLYKNHVQTSKFNIIENNKTYSDILNTLNYPIKISIGIMDEFF